VITSRLCPASSSSYYLAPPIPLDGGLYVLTEKKKALQLLCLDPLTGNTQATYTLGEMKQSLLVEPQRRRQAAVFPQGDNKFGFDKLPRPDCESGS
jgi:hypothetical protein